MAFENTSSLGYSKITPKRAVEIAKTYLKQFIKTTDIQLEEIELLESGYWQITLSFPANHIESAFGVKSKRKYRIFSIDSISGGVKSMKIRRID